MIFQVIAEFWHAYVDLFVRPLKIIGKRQVWFWRPDNKPPYYKKDLKPIGYWLGHIIAYFLVFVWLMYALTHIEVA